MFIYQDIACTLVTAGVQGWSTGPAGCIIGPSTWPMAPPAENRFHEKIDKRHGLHIFKATFGSISFCTVPSQIIIYK